MIRDTDRRKSIKRITELGGTTAAKCVYFYLASCSGQNGCHPKQDTIAEALGLSRRTVNKSIAWLAEKGLIEIRSLGKIRSYVLALCENHGSQECENRGSQEPENRSSQHIETSMVVVVEEGNETKKDGETIFRKARRYLLDNLSRMGATNDDPRTATFVDQISWLAAEWSVAGRPIQLKKLVGVAQRTETAAQFGVLVNQVDHVTGGELRKRFRDPEARTSARRA